MKGRIVFIESNTTGTGETFVKVASDLGYEAVILSHQPDRYDFVRSGICQAIKINTQSIDDIVKCCEELNETRPVKAILSTSEYFIVQAHKAAEKLGLHGAVPKAAARCRDKSEQRKLLANHIPTPKNRAVSNAVDAALAADQIGYPVIIKPVSESGSIGVSLCHDSSQVRAAASEVQVCGVSSSTKHTGEFLVEEYIDGPEYSVECFDGISFGVTQKHLGPLPRFIEIGHDFPAEIDEDLQSRIFQTVNLALDKIGLTSGPAHAEVRVRDGDAFLIEINARLGGDQIPFLVELATGVNLIEQTVVAALGEEIEFPNILAKKGAAIRFYLAENPDDYPSSDDAANVGNFPGFVQFVAIDRGENQGELYGDFRDRRCYVIADGSNSNTAGAAAAAALESLKRQADRAAI